MKILRIGSSKGEYFTLLKNIDDVRRYVEIFCKNLSITESIGDLSLLTNDAQSSLLKFIEEGVIDIVCYASRDNISPVLMSRFDKIEKFEDIKIGRNDFETFVRYVEEKEGKFDCLEREFTGRSVEYLQSFLLYRKMNKAMLSRIADLL